MKLSLNIIINFGERSQVRVFITVSPKIRF